MTHQTRQDNMEQHLDDQGRFVIRNYHLAKPFSNFFPGIAGLWGIPMWLFYVNRGQCVASFGLESKDKAILEFHPANKAYRQTPMQGFRTFIKVSSSSGSQYWEPFQNHVTGTQFRKDTALLMRAHDLTIEEVNHDLGLKISVNYFTMPEEPYAALVRQVTLENLGSAERTIEMIDGLPVINPYGLGDWVSKHMCRTVEAWVKVRNLENKVPFYQLKVEVADTPVVKPIHEGHFFFSFDASSKKLLTPIVEAAKVFGSALDFGAPDAFLSGGFSASARQETSNRLPAAFAHDAFTLKPNASRGIVSLFGYAYRQDNLPGLVQQVTGQGFLERKRDMNQRLIDDIKSFAFTNSSSREFNLYAEHTFLDNILRGGLPVSLKTGAGNVVFNVYSRKHGDPERDYNFFVLAPTFYSQGNGNYRDVNQNRRCDVWFNEDVKETHIVTFMNLVQADGYNPLVVKGTSFKVENEAAVNEILQNCVKSDDQAGREELKSFFKQPFQPGELLSLVGRKNIALKIDIKEFIGRVLDLSHKEDIANHGEGFWSDHWTYNLDLIETYLSLYPEKLQSLLLGEKIFEFFLNDHYVLPRDHRYMLTDRGVRQYESVHDGKKDIRSAEKGFRLRTHNGQGHVYRSSLATKLLCLIANKVATLDPSGIGIEMEADKPNWYDALNGLPGLLGSSISETMELKRYALFLLNSIDKIGLDDRAEIPVFIELFSFIRNLTDVLATEINPQEYWRKSGDIKEMYRKSVREGINGDEENLRVYAIRTFLMRVIERADIGLKAARNAQGFLPTYFFHEVTKHESVREGEKAQHGYVLPLAFKRHDLPLFLEGYVHVLRTLPGQPQAKALYTNVRDSELFDRKLKMYKVNAPLASQTDEIGRTRVFPSGWLENESVWLHMEYKFMLELLRNGLYEEFYADIKNVFIPFLDPRTYGRSILENSSFLASSAHEDEALHGQGFVARLSGSTAEFLHMWLLMNLGQQPFFMDESQQLGMRFAPALPKSFFTDKETQTRFRDQLTGDVTDLKLPANTYAFSLFGSTLVVYHNPVRKDTFGVLAAKVNRIELHYRDGRPVAVINGDALKGTHAYDLRDRRIKRVDVHFA